MPWVSLLRAVVGALIATDLELATAEWVDWFNNQRLHTAIGDIPPHEHEINYYAQCQTQPAAGASTDLGAFSPKSASGAPC